MTFYRNRKSNNNTSATQHAESFTKAAPKRPARPARPTRPMNKAVSTLNPEHLIRKAVDQTTTKYQSPRTYDEFPLHEVILKNLKNKGFERPTEIQDKSIEVLLQGKNVIGIAATGTGKTGAFLIPMIHQMLNDQTITGLVVVPTRELALQVEAEFKSLTLNTRLKSVCFIGGTSVNKDLTLARQPHRLVVGTPGRLKDLMSRGALHIQHTNILILDEFDRMLEMGFVNDIKHIIQAMKKREQTILFSATLQRNQEKIINDIITNPVHIKVDTGTKSSELVDQNIIRVAPDKNKFDVLYDLICEDSFEKVILFAETKRIVDQLSKQLVKAGIKSDVIHGNKSQNYRNRAIEEFKSGVTRVLVATDVAARGIDIEGITHVINYQLPMTMDSYIHRIGRTGRAGKTGKAYTFVN